MWNILIADLFPHSVRLSFQLTYETCPSHLIHLQDILTLFLFSEGGWFKEVGSARTEGILLDAQQILCHFPDKVLEEMRRAQCF